MGSAHDDRITDLASGEKKISGGDGNDEITVGASALIDGGDGDDLITGSHGNDTIVGGAGGPDGNRLFGGGGSDRILSQASGDRLEGSAGSDHLEVQNFGGGEIVVVGGSGNDLISLSPFASTRCVFGIGAGHDTVSGASSGFGFESQALIEIVSVGFDGLDFRWDVEIPPYDGTPYQLFMTGDLLITIRESGDTLFLPAVSGTLHRLSGGPSHIHINTSLSLADGRFDGVSFTVGSDDHPQFSTGSVGHMNLAPAEYASGVRPEIEPVGGDGADDLSGGQGDDAIAAGAGDDSIEASGGNDTVDGGDGVDLLRLFGAVAGYLITREENGDIFIEDLTGIEGTIKLTSVEIVYFATDNATFTVGDLVGYYGTEGNDTIVASDLSNLLFGLAGNDILNAGLGSDLIDGGAGADVAQYDGDRGDYSFINQGRGPAHIYGPEGTDVVVGIEQLQFANGTWAVPADLFVASMMQGSSSFGADLSAGGWDSQNSAPRAIEDVNGDGIADVVGFDTSGTFVALGRSDGRFGAAAQVSTQFGQAASAGGWVSNDRSPRTLADVNGDGRAGAGTYVV